jgi:hypothetical protein
MQKAIWALLMATGIGLLFLWGPPGLRTGDAVPDEKKAAPVAEAAVQWEYKIFPMNELEYREKKDYKDIASKHKDPVKRHAAFQEYVLNHLGKRGWELIYCDIRSSALSYFYFKRRVP